MAKPKRLRYIVTGPGLDTEPSYEEPGAALSRSITAAECSQAEGTWYVRDSIGGDILAHSEVSYFEGARCTSTRWTAAGLKAIRS